MLKKIERALFWTLVAFDVWAWWIWSYITFGG